MEKIYVNLNTSVNVDFQLSCAFGFFDGVHLAHQQLFKKTLEVAQKTNTKSAVITFYPNPNYVIEKTSDNTYLTPRKVKEAIIRDFGFDYLIVVEFSLAVSKLTHQEFVNKILGKFHIKNIIVGYDNHYGYKGEGTVDTLKLDSVGLYNIYVVDELEYQGEKIGSSRIKALLKSGRVSEVINLLGRNYMLSGIVVHGHGLGRTIGVPTANISLDYPYTIPQNGVYLVYVTVSGKKYKGVCNIGNNPTFNYVSHTSIEVNILDFSEEIYQQEIELEFIIKIRDEKKFATTKQLVAEITKNQEFARKYKNKTK